MRLKTELKLTNIIQPKTLSKNYSGINAKYITIRTVLNGKLKIILKLYANRKYSLISVG